MKKIVYILLLLSICLIPRVTFAATKVSVSNDSELRSALQSTNENEILLTDDVEITYDSTLEDEDNYLIVNAGKHILNLNNHTIRTTSPSQSDYGLITVLGGSLELKGNGQVAAQNVVLSVIGGTLTINGGTYISGDENHIDLVLITYSGKTIINKGSFIGEIYAEGPASSGGGTDPSQGSSLPILASNVPASVQVGRNNVSQKLGSPLDTKPNVTINEGTFNSTTYAENIDLTINGGTFGGDNAVEVKGNNSKLKVNGGNLAGEDIGLLVNTSDGDPVVALQGGNYSCTDCEEQSIQLGAITIGPFTDQKDGNGLLTNILGQNALIDDDAITEETADYNNASIYYYHTKQTVNVTTPVPPTENKEIKEETTSKEEIENPDTSDNVLLSIIALISSFSIILVGTKKLNNN